MLLRRDENIGGLGSGVGVPLIGREGHLRCLPTTAGNAPTSPSTFPPQRSSFSVIHKQNRPFGAPSQSPLSDRSSVAGSITTPEVRAFVINPAWGKFQPNELIPYSCPDLRDQVHKSLPSIIRLTTPPSMTSTLFTTDDGDVILRAGTEPDSKHDFRIHKFILSLASPVFKDMFALPQPPNQTLDEQNRLPVVDVPDLPKVLDVILRLIYPGVEPPTITEPQTLSTLLATADKYNIASISPILREKLKGFLPRCPLWVYVIACRFGFLEEVKEAAKLTTMQSFLYFKDCEDLQHISSADIFRLVQFIQERETAGRRRIRDHLDPSYLEDSTTCEHCGEDVQDYYFHLMKEVEDVFVENPLAQFKDLVVVLGRIPDPPPGCERLPKPGDWYYEGGDEEALSCPLQPMTIRGRLSDVADDLRLRNVEMLRKFFVRGAGNA